MEKYKEEYYQWVILSLYCFTIWNNGVICITLAPISTDCRSVAYI